MIGESAPAYCPKCGDEHNWLGTEINGPYHVSAGDVAKSTAVLGLFGVFGLLLHTRRHSKKIEDRNAYMIFHCFSCGHEEEYDKD